MDVLSSPQLKDEQLVGTEHMASASGPSGGRGHTCFSGCFVDQVQEEGQRAAEELANKQKQRSLWKFPCHPKRFLPR